MYLENLSAKYYYQQFCEFHVCSTLGISFVETTFLRLPCILTYRMLQLCLQKMTCTHVYCKLSGGWAAFPS